MCYSVWLISSKYVSRIYFLLHVFEAFVEAVGDDGADLGLEGCEVVHHAAAEEGGAVVEGGFVDDDFRALGFHALHDALDGRLTEVVGVALHRQAVHADDAFASLLAVLVVARMVVPACLAQHGVGDVVLARTVALDDGGHHVLGHVGIVGQELLVVFGQASYLFESLVFEIDIVVIGDRVDADASTSSTPSC